jgi:peptidoglycan/xylan/chitin deacetylase (PgdA/CDA1 family)
MKIALTHDVDRTKKSYQYVTHFFKNLIKLKWSNAFYHLRSLFLSNPYWNFETIIGIENELNVKSTFYFLNESIKFNLFDLHNWQLSLGRYDIKGKKIVDMIRYLDTNGWEIGVHGSYLSNTDKDMLSKEKKVLEDLVGHDIAGIRQHYLRLDKRTWQIQQQCGFKYDTSFGHTDNIGYKDNRYEPFRPMNDDFVVYPQVIMDKCFMATDNKWEKFNEILKISEEKNSVLVINWHQRVFNENEFPEYMDAYIKIIRLLKTSGAEFYKLIDLLDMKLGKND